MKFELREDQIKLYKEWKKSLPPFNDGAIGGGTTFCFTPTGLGMCVEVKRGDGHSIDLSKDDYKNW